MATYVKAYLGSTPLFATDTTWSRQIDWLNLTAVPADGFVGLHAVFSSGTNYSTIRMTTDTGAAYTINWGDGSAPETAASNTTINHNFSWSGTSSSTLTSRGYRQALVTVTPAAGSKFTSCSIANKPTTPVFNDNTATSGWLDINFNLPNLTTGGARLYVGGGTFAHRYLEKVNIVSWGAQTSCNGMFANCPSLQSINSASWNMASITDVTGMFQNCFNLQYIDGSTWNTSSITTFLNFARECNSLIEAKCSSWNLISNTSFQFAFYNCTSLQYIDVSSWNTANVVTTDRMFANCKAVQFLNVRSWNMAKNANANSMFNGCYALQNIDISLWSIPLLTNATGMFGSCFALEKLEACNFGAATNMTTFCANCYSLKSVTLTGINTSVDFSNCQLSGTALDAIYTNLASTGTGKTITVTGNFGTTSDTPTIATAKGWTVTGS